MKRDINFLKVYNTKNNNKFITITENDKAYKYALISVLILLLFSMGIFYYSSYLNKLILETKENINSSDYAKSYEYISGKQVVYEDVKLYNELVTDSILKIESIPKLTIIEYETLKNNLIPGMEILSMRYFQGNYELTIKAPYARNVPQFVSSIKNSGIFESVTYNGFDLSEIVQNTDNLTASNQYLFTIVCKLKSGVNDEIN